MIFLYLMALVIYMIPVYLVVIAQVIAWKWERVGAVVFIGLVILYVVISGTLVVIGAVFGVGWKYRKA